MAFYYVQVNAAAEVIYDLVDPTANLIFGAVIDPSLSGQVSKYNYVNSLLFYMLLCKCFSRNELGNITLVQ
jgi:hypothetical protein